MTEILVSKGNKKLPKTTYILNMGSATDCPSKTLGLCQAGKYCYALKAEKLYKNTLPYRNKQKKQWDTLSAKELAARLLALSKSSKKHYMKIFRFSESGDFATQQDVDKMTELCSILSSHNINCMGYTARTDLNLSKLIQVASVCVSNDINSWVTRGANRFKIVDIPTNKNLVCAGNCRNCSLCTTTKGRVIEVKKH